MPFISLLLYAIGVSLYDLRHQRIPNWASLPVLAAAVIAAFPGNLSAWITVFLLLAAWRYGVLGGGDVKLWMAVIWWAVSLPGALLVMFASFTLTGLVQLAVRRMRGHPLIGVKSPGAWRVIPFILYYGWWTYYG